MIITKKSADKKRSYFGIFSKFYFYTPITLLFCILLLLFSTGYLNKHKERFLYRFYKSSVDYYINIFEIGFYALKGTFYTIPELNINISFKNIVKLENNRKDSIEKAGEDIDGSFDFLEVPGRIQQKNRSYKSDIRLKGDRVIHFNERKYSSY